MAITILIVSGKFLSIKNDGTPNSGGFVYLFDPGTSTPKTTYSNSSLVTANAHPVVLDSAGRAIIYFSGNADIRVEDSANATIYTQSNVNPTTVTSTANITTATTLDSTYNGKWVTTTANITLPTAASAGAGWQVNLKSLSSSMLVISRSSGGDTLNGALSSMNLPPNESVSIIVNNGITGFNILFNALLEVGTGINGQVLGYVATGPAWQTVDLINAGNDLYNYYNFT